MERIDLDRLLRRAVFFAGLNLVGEEDELDFVPIFVIVDAMSRLRAEIVPYEGPEEFNAGLAAFGQRMRGDHVRAYAFVMSVRWPPTHALTNERPGEYIEAAQTTVAATATDGFNSRSAEWTLRRDPDGIISGLDRREVVTERLEDMFPLPKLGGTA